MNSFAKFIDILVAVIVCFLFPTTYFAQKQDTLTQMMVTDVTQDLMDTVQVQGELTQELYNKFLYQLSRIGAYEVRLKREYMAIEPEYESTEGNPVFTGLISVYWADITHDEILQVLETEGVYQFERGDTLDITVTNRVKTLATLLLQIPYGLSMTNEQIIVTLTAEIRDSE